MKKLLLIEKLCPGDTLMLTAAVRELSKRGYKVDIDTPHPEIWENNPYITKLGWKRNLETQELIIKDEEIQVIQSSYTNAINSSNKKPYHFIHGYCQDLEDKLNIKIRLSEFKGDIFLTSEEQQEKVLDWDKKYWIINAGGKESLQTKWLNPTYMQEVIDYFKDKIQFVQVGKQNDWHLPLKNTINLIGKTTIRDLIKLTYSAQGILCPITFLMHLSKAVPINKNIHKFDIRPTVVINGGREPATWERYEGHKFLDTIGTMDCCSKGGCWKSHLIKEKETDRLCKYPIEVKNELYIAKCIMNITPKRIIDAIESYFENELISYLE